VGRYSLADRVAERLLDMVLGEEVDVGGTLPPTGDLAKRFDVSVVVVREAVAKLAGLGILQRRQGKEPVVSLPDPAVVGRILRVYAHYERLSVDELQRSRSALEVDVARAAAQAEDTAEARALALEPSLRGMQEAKNGAEFNASDLEFHFALAELSGNRASQLLLLGMSDLIRETLELTFKAFHSRKGREAKAEAFEVHKAIADAVVAGDADRAAEAMLNHFTYLQDRTELSGVPPTSAQR
jgi:DNA-binding FadR family transcriptional regulator